MPMPRMVYPLGILIIASCLIALAAWGAGAADLEPPKEFVICGAYSPPPPSWSPDGTHLAYTVATKKGPVVCKVSVDGKSRKVLCEGYEPMWSPKGDKIALLRKGDDLYVVSAAGGNARRLAEHVNTRFVGSRVVWSPDGRHIAFEKSRRWKATTNPLEGSSFECGDVYVAEAASGALRRLTRFEEAFPEGVALPGNRCDVPVPVMGWTADSKAVVVRGPGLGDISLGLCSIDLDTRNATEFMEGILQAWPISLSPDGKTMLAIDRGYYVEIGLDGAPRVAKLGPFEEPADTRIWHRTFSWPERVVIGGGTVKSTNEYKLFMFEVDTGTPRVLTEGDVYEASPVCSPDGSLVAFYRHQNGRSALYTMRPDGTQTRTLASCQE